MNNVISFDQIKQRHNDNKIFSRWVDFYTAQPHEEVLEALVHEHENDFPLRGSKESLDQLRHKALIHVLQARAQTEFLLSFLAEIQQGGAN